MKTIIDNFVDRVIEYGMYNEIDKIYVKNRVLALIGEEGTDRISDENDLKQIKDYLVEIALKNGKIKDLIEEKECLGAELMNFIVPLPSRLNDIFWSSYDISPQEAVEEFYKLSKDSDYIKTSAIAKNIEFRASTKYGELEITINLSKPEKDPKTIAAEKLVKATNYPKCLLCMENEGYQGRINYPARSNHRIIRLKLGDEVWGFQYSPYLYFNEHAIFLNSQHVPMAITSKTFEQLLEIVDILPGYFAGSNSDLPISGGSILSHNHYQGGKHIFPMEKAKFESEFRFKDFEDVNAGIVKWPMSVIRLQSENKNRLLDLATKILNKWREYSDLEVDIIAMTEDVQHIKKENIGLIEVMGLAILPPRLKPELEEVGKYLLGEENAIADYHLEWADQLKEKYPRINKEEVNNVVQHEAGQVFARVLEDAGVYKNTPSGHEAFMRFVKSVGIN
ncbi:TPA: UDP-glucose--hexose-1-phosphate uridylyltransferase [Streptococcus pneumoniae]|nr:UDP-glucose--hexose-1-phosphate uridylyltransferase [Streptococcus pneumoniae]